MDSARSNSDDGNNYAVSLTQTLAQDSFPALVLSNVALIMNNRLLPSLSTQLGIDNPRSGVDS